MNRKNEYGIEKLEMDELFEKTVLILGVGAIGREIARTSQGI